MTEAQLRAILRLGGTVHLQSRRTGRVWSLSLTEQGKFMGLSNQGITRDVRYMTHGQILHHLNNFPDNFSIL